MAQANSNDTTTLARRDFIVGAALAVPAVAAAPLAAMASSGVDPIFPAIEEYRAAVKTTSAAISEHDRPEDFLMEKGLGLNPHIPVVDASGTHSRWEPTVIYRHEDIDRFMPPDRFSELNAEAHAALDARIQRHDAIIGDSKDVLFDAQTAEDQALDILVWTSPITIAGSVALLELLKEIMRTTPEVLGSDQIDTMISSVTDVLRDAQPSA